MVPTFSLETSRSVIWNSSRIAVSVSLALATPFSICRVQCGSAAGAVGSGPRANISPSGFAAFCGSATIRGKTPARVDIAKCVMIAGKSRTPSSLTSAIALTASMARSKAADGANAAQRV